MAVGVVIFGVHSAIDWTWFVPGNVVPALLLRGLGRRPRAAARAARGAGRAAEPRRRRAAEPRRAGGRSARAGARRVLAALALVVALAAAWAAYQPVRSVHAGDEALDRLDAGAYEPAVAIAQTAVDRNPLSVDPLFDLAAIQQARGQTPRRRRPRSCSATELQPANAEAWRRLGQFRLDALAEPRAALKDFQVAYYLDPQNRRSWTDLIDATRAVRCGRRA